MTAYGYSPSSFRNLTGDEARAKSVPARYKLRALMNQLDEADLCVLLDLIVRSLASRPKGMPLAFLDGPSTDSVAHAD